MGINGSHSHSVTSQALVALTRPPNRSADEFFDIVTVFQLQSGNAGPLHVAIAHSPVVEHVEDVVVLRQPLLCRFEEDALASFTVKHSASIVEQAVIPTEAASAHTHRGELHHLTSLELNWQLAFEFRVKVT